MNKGPHFRSIKGYYGRVVWFYIIGRGTIVIVDRRFHNYLFIKNFTFGTENQFEFLSPKIRYYLRVWYIYNIKYFVF
jgi:hypothetical protein